MQPMAKFQLDYLILPICTQFIFRFVAMSYSPFARVTSVMHRHINLLVNVKNLHLEIDCFEQFGAG